MRIDARRRVVIARLEELRGQGFALPVGPRGDIDYLEQLADQCEAYRVPRELAEAHMHLARAQWRPAEQAAVQHVRRDDDAVCAALAAHLLALDDAELDRVRRHVEEQPVRPGLTAPEMVLLEGLADILGL
jgi:hypothetical protein